MNMVLDEYVRTRFDELEGRFRDRVDPDDYRLAAIARAIGDPADRRILDLGCGKGRFARRLQERGARVVGLDGAGAMLRRAAGLPRVRACARRLPFPANTFDAVIAVEILEHVASPATVLGEAARVLQPGGTLVVIDKNALALDARRPWLPAALVKRLDEHRGRWMYPAHAPFRERWFVVRSLRRQLEGFFDDVAVEALLAPAEARHAVFRVWPPARLMTAWIARAPRRTVS